jgi:hypothetical protein
VILARHVACVGEMRNSYKILDRKPEGVKPLRRFRCRWGDNIKIYLREKVGKVWTGRICFRTGTNGELF